jgi:hypothetical protein
MLTGARARYDLRLWLIALPIIFAVVTTLYATGWIFSA